MIVNNASSYTHWIPDEALIAGRSPVLPTVELPDYIYEKYLSCDFETLIRRFDPGSFRVENLQHEPLVYNAYKLVRNLICPKCLPDSHKSSVT